MTGKFELGQVVATATAAHELTQGQMLAMIYKHHTGNWGELCNEDKRANEDALKFDARILSRYNVGTEGYYVITEWDRSVTTLMNVRDY